jgi:hypothetical protein
MLVGSLEASIMDIVGKQLISRTRPETEFSFEICDMKKNATPIVNGESGSSIFEEGA